MKGREESIILKREYILRWKDYSDLSKGDKYLSLEKKKYDKFRYLLVTVKS